jgi:hypothetical protein
LSAEAARRYRRPRRSVNPVFRGGDGGRAGEYRAAAEEAHDRCFIGQTVAAGGAACEVGTVDVA